MLRCPLCHEDHPIPSTGASGFREDFRIKALIDKMGRLTEKASPDTKTSTAHSFNSEGGICSIHPEFRLDYYCTEVGCKIVICRSCWTGKHQNHLVTPAVARHEMVNTEVEATRIKEITAVKETLSKSTKDVKHNVHLEFHKTREVLNSIQDKFIKNIEQHYMREIYKLNSELDKFLLLQEEVQEVLDLDLDLNKDQVLHIRNIKENAALWDLEILKPCESNDPVVKLNFCPIKYENEAVRKKEDIYEENKDTHFQKLPPGKQKVMKDSVLANVQPYSEHHQQEGSQKNSTNKNLDIPRVPTGQDVACFRKLLPRMQKVMKDSNSENHQQEVSQKISTSDHIPTLIDLDIPRVLTVQDIPSLHLPSKPISDILSPLISLDHRKDKVHYMTFSPQHGLILVQDDYLRGFKDQPFNVKSFCTKWNSNGPVGIIQRGEQDYLVEHDLKAQKLYFFPYKSGCFQPSQCVDIPCQMPARNFSCVAGYVIYSHARKKLECTHVTCSSATQTLPPCELWENMVPVDGGLESAICAGIDDLGYPFVVCAHTPPGGFQSYTCQVVLQAISDMVPSKCLWNLTHEQLDRYATYINIVDMVFDGDQFFVLNKTGKQSYLYILSKDGMDREKSITIPGGQNMAVDRQNGHLFIATEDHMIYVFNIIGKL